jgi:hypothetical protein
VRLCPGARWTAGSGHARRLLFVLSGTGSAASSRLTEHSSIQIDPGERTEIECNDAIEMLIFGLPPIAEGETGTAARTE